MTAANGLRVLRRVTGIGTAASLALALLTAGSVLAAVAGPRQAQATGARALRQTIGGLPPLDQNIVVAGNWSEISVLLEASTYAQAQLGSVNFTSADLADTTTHLRRDFGTGPLPLAAQSADWAGMTAAPYSVAPMLPILNGIPAELEVAYRYPVASHVRLVAGTMPDASSGPILRVVVTTQTARVFGLQPGSRLVIDVPSSTDAGQIIPVKLEVTGIVAPTDPASSFWGADPLLPRPALEYLSGGDVWQGAVIADPGEAALLQSIFGVPGLTMKWVLPINAARVQGQAQALASQVSTITNRAPGLAGDRGLAPMAEALTVSSGLVQPLAALVQASNGVNVLLWMVYVGLAVAGVVVLLLATRMIAARRSAELTLYQARGASLVQVFLLGFRGAAVVCLPAGALAWAVAVLLVPGSAPAGPAAWWPGILTLALATAGPAAAAVWQHRPPQRVRRRRRKSWETRVVFEVTACLAAIGGIVIARTQTGAGDLYASAAPVLVAVPVVIVVLRLYSVLLHGLARVSARQRGVIGFVGITRAAQATATLALPAMTIVLAVTVAAFTGMVRDAVVRGETALSWQATGADAVVAAPFSLNTLESLISPSAVRAIAAVPGVQHAATALVVPLRTAGGQEISAIAVDPASYAALVRSTEGFSPVNPALLTQSRGQAATPVLASPQAAADLGGQAGGVISQQGLPALRLKVTGQLQSTPAFPAGGAFVVLPLSAIGSIGGSTPVNLMLLTGPSIDMSRLSAAVQATAGGAGAPSITSRSAALQELAGAPLQQGTFVLFTLAIGYAAALALVVILLELALGAADRELAMARLAAMGLANGQRGLLAAFEVLPAVAASAVAAVACAVALPRIVAPAINLSVFTQSPAPVPLRPDLASFVLPLAGILVVTVIALAYEIRSGRGHSVAATMRAS
jgi:putative ABC transport system permease protein